MKVGIIGAGASGMMAAVTAADYEAEVTLFEKNERVGKKILSTGNGKCNISNLDFSIEKYYCCDKEKLHKVFSVHSLWDSISFFESNGLMLRSRDGYLYPYCEQASAVLDMFRRAIDRKKIRLVAGEEIKVLQYQKHNGKFLVQGASFQEEFDRIVIACGGPASQKKGEGMTGFCLAEQFGHRIHKIVPGLTGLRGKDSFVKAMAGVRCHGRVKLVADGAVLAQEEGELQFTDYGISGIPVFQFSRVAAYALEEGKQVQVLVDFFPDYEENAFWFTMQNRFESGREATLEEFLTGTVNKKVNMALLKKEGFKPGERVKEIGYGKLKKLLGSYKNLTLHISSVNSMENAQVCAGGVAFSEVSSELESEKQKGLYFAGEVLDIDGKCGGYNLQWAWTSGYIAGRNAAGSSTRNLICEEGKGEIHA